MNMKDTALHAQLEQQIAQAAQKIKGCWEKEEAFCVAACPFHYDIREFNARLKRGSFNSAYRLLANAVGFPAIVAALCPQPCRQACVRRDSDAAVYQRQLEAAALQYAANTKPNSYNMPAKPHKIAIVGAGLSGLGCALRLCNKKYSVTVFEAADVIGGRLWQRLSPQVFLAEFELQFLNEQYELRLGSRISAVEPLLAQYDAVYVASGAQGDDFGLLAGLAQAAGVPPYATARRGVFCGGALCGGDDMQALAQGLQAATLIEAYVKTGNMKGALPHAPTKMRLAPGALQQTAPACAEGEPLSKAQAQAEAGRCLGCRCDACFRHCPMMRYLEKFPLRIEDEVHVTIYPGTLDGDGTVATRLIATCNHCGLCAEACPQDIDVGDYLRKSHQFMHNKGSMPWVFHDFWLRDMAHARDERFYALQAAPSARPAYLYFPGCQLAASEPNYVSGSYALLRQAAPDTAIMLGCCGAPALWAGDNALHEEVFAEIAAVWREYGQPTVITACPSCQQMFRQYLPQLRTSFLFDALAALGITPLPQQEASAMAVFDPCAMRRQPQSRAVIRQTARQAGLVLQELPAHDEMARCCSFGGQVDIASPRYAKALAQHNAAASGLPYLVYCSNCRDVLRGVGKEARHALELFPGCARGNEAAPGIEQRRVNRALARRQIVTRFFPGRFTLYEETSEMQLNLAAGLSEKLERERIYVADIEAVISACEADKRRIRTAEGHYFGYRELGYGTYWVEYAPHHGGYTVYNAYAHRMRIESEEHRHE